MNYVTGIVQIRQCLGQLENKKNTGRGSRCLSGKQLPASRAATHLEKAILQLHVQEISKSQIKKVSKENFKGFIPYFPCYLFSFQDESNTL